LAKSGDAREDLIGGLGPDEWLGLPVGPLRRPANLATISIPVARSIDFIGSNFRDAHVQAIAAAVGVSTGHLSRLFLGQVAVTE
jgi:hypothetical protein